MTSSSRTEPWIRFYWSVQRQIPSSRGNSQCANTIVQLFSPQQEESIVNCAVPCSPQQHHFPGLNYYCSRTRTRHSGVLVLLQVSSTPSEPIDSSPRSDWVHCLNPYSQQNGSFLLRRMVIRKNTYTNIDNIVVEKKCYPSSGCSVMTPTIDNSNLPKFPPSPPITQWMAGAICGKQRKPYCSSVATRAPPIKSHPDRIGHFPSLCLSTTKKMLFIIWRIENTWGEIEKFCNIYDQCLLHSIFT